jgi:phenylacetate-CoA ligase
MTGLSAAGAMRLLDELNARGSWPRERLIEHQRCTLREIVRHAAECSPYYREALPARARDDNVRLEELPTLSKQTLMREWDRIVTDPRLRLVDAERHLDGSASGEMHLGEYLVLATGGATGQRGVFVYGQAEFDACLAGCLRGLATMGISAGTRLAAIGSPSPAHLTNQVFGVLRAGRTDAPRLTVTMPLDELVSALNACQPEAIIAYATLVQFLADEQRAGRLRVAPRIVVSTSEVLAEGTRRLVEDVWGVRIHNAYASTEAGMMATECGQHCGLQVWEDMLIFEVVDEHNGPVPPGVPGHKVLLTNLWNRVQPLIRYELADTVTLAAGANPTGGPFARIADVQGRTADILRLPGAAGGTVSVHPIHLCMPFTRMPEVRQYQFHPGDDQIRVTLVLAPQAPSDVIERIRAELTEAIKTAGGIPPPLHIEAVDSIPRLGSGAKLTLVRPGACTPV